MASGDWPVENSIKLKDCSSASVLVVCEVSHQHLKVGFLTKIVNVQQHFQSIW